MLSRSFASFRLQSQILVVLGVLLCGFLVFGLTAWRTFEDVRIGGSAYRNIVRSKDLISDVLPPPSYIIESYLVVLQLRDASTPEARRLLKARLEELKQDYEAHHTAWLREPLSPELKELFCKTSHEPAARFYEQAFAKYIPAILSGDIARRETALTELTHLHTLHRQAIDEVVQLANQANTVEEARARSTLSRSRTMAVVSFALSAIVALVLFFLVTQPIVTSLHELSGKFQAMAGGNLDQNFRCTRGDEIGDVFASAAFMQAELRNASQRFRQAVEASPTGMVMIGSDGRIILVNSQAERLFGYSRDELLGQPVELLVPQRVRERLPQLRDSYFAQPQVLSMDSERDLHGVRKNGSEFPVELGLNPLATEDGIFTLASIVDITERKNTERVLQQAKAMAESANRAKSDFLANMSHEIRTPMNGIIGMSDLALDTDLTREQREYLETVKSSADSLLRIINDILDFSKIEAGKLELDPQPFRLRESLGETMKTLAVRAHEKHLELVWQIPADVPDCLVGDAGRLRQIVVNLTGNAIKFTERGEVGVVVDCASRTESSVRLRFSVSDTGIGIPQEKQSLIFEAFTQADASTTRSFGGTGLGLSISRQLVRLMGGELSLISEEGRGSTFCFTIELPLSSVSPDEATDELNIDLTGVRVLVVDDNQTNRRILSEMLTAWRMEPTLAESGRAGLDELRRAAMNGTPYSLVLTDCHMPQMDGFMFVEELRKHPELNRATIMMLTSAERFGSYERCQRLGIKATLQKPLKQSELQQSIIAILGKAIHAESKSSTPGTSPLPAIAASQSGPRLHLLLAEDNYVNQQVAVRILQKLGHHVQIVENGQLALDTLQTESFDAVLMDVQMPVLDGFKAVAEIRERERGTGRHLPVIAITAHAMTGDRERCFAAGMDDYVSKPIRAEELREALARIVNSAAFSTGTANLTPPVEIEEQAKADPANLAFDLTAALERVDGEREFLAELAGIYMDEMPRLVASLQQAVEQSSDHAVSDVAHAIKGTVANFCAQAAYEAAFELEQITRQGATENVPSAHRTLIREVHRLTQDLKREFGLA